MSNEEQNKNFVLEAFETLFNKRDYAAAERFWSPDYIQHSAYIAPGREGLFDLVKAAPAEFRYENGLAVPLFRIRRPGKLYRGRHSSHRKRPARRTLGRDPGRGHARRIEERAPDVRRQLPELIGQRRPRRARQFS
jgi:hypothetical protein